MVASNSMANFTVIAYERHAIVFDVEATSEDEAREKAAALLEDGDHSPAEYSSTSEPDEWTVYQLT
jgi:hypothetical protein